MPTLTSAPQDADGVTRCLALIAECQPLDTLIARLEQLSLSPAAVALLHFICFPAAHPLSLKESDNVPAPNWLGAQLRDRAWLAPWLAPGQLPNDLQPDLIYEIVPPPADRFSELAAQHGTTLEFHGSDVVKMHSILWRGLMMKYAKNMIYGDGLYFTSDPRVGLNFVHPTHHLLTSPTAPPAAPWRLRRPFHCLCAFEVLQSHPAIRRPQPNDPAAAGLAVHAGSLPPKYVVAQSAEYVRLRAVFVYFESASVLRPSIRPYRSFLWLYLLILLVLALTGSTTWYSAKRWIMQRMYAADLEFLNS
jgi:hypothetical protein